MAHHVCLTFDFDSVSLWMAMGQTSPTPISRGEFGVVAAERILALLDKHDISGSWFTPGVTIETYPDACRRIHEAGHEIGHHGFAHVSPRGMSRAEELDALQKGNAAIRSVTGANATGYRSPAWDLSDHSVELLLGEGFLYDSSMMAHDFQPYFARNGDRIEGERMVFGEETELVEMPISWSLDDFPHFEYFRGGGLMNANQVLENWLGDYDYMAANSESGILTYTFHPFVIGRGHRMLMLEKLITSLRQRGAEFLRMDEACQVVLSSK